MKLEALTSECRELMGTFTLTSINDHSNNLISPHKVEYFVEVDGPTLNKEKDLLEFEIVGKFRNQSCENKMGLKFYCTYYDGSEERFDHFDLRL